MTANDATPDADLREDRGPSRRRREVVAAVALIALLGWRLSASLAAERRRVFVAPVAQRIDWLRASAKQRYRWTLRDQAPLYFALKEHLETTPTDANAHVYLYLTPDSAGRDGAPGPRSEPQLNAAQLGLLELQLRELLFPVPVTAIVGPVDVTPPALIDYPLLIANLTPSAPLPGEDRYQSLPTHGAFHLWRVPANR